MKKKANCMALDTVVEFDSSSKETSWVQSHKNIVCKSQSESKKLAVAFGERAGFDDVEKSSSCIISKTVCGW